MTVHPTLQDDLRQALKTMERLPLLTVLEQQGVLMPLLRQLQLERLRQSVRCGPDAIEAIARELCQEVSVEPPLALDRHWPEALPEAVAAQVGRRWQQRLLALAIEARYGERLEAHYLSRRPQLDQVVFRMMRLEQLGLAEELYLSLIDDGASFGELAERHGLGEERHTRGLVGPLPLDQPHPRIRMVLSQLGEGEVAPPFQVEGTVLLLRLDKRVPARLTPAIRERLLAELMEADLEARGHAALAELRADPAAVPTACSVAPRGPLVPVAIAGSR
jgi:hypothetical protein